MKTCIVPSNGGDVLTVKRDISCIPTSDMTNVGNYSLNLMKYGKYYSSTLCIGGLIKKVKEIG